MESGLPFVDPESAGKGLAATPSIEEASVMLLAVMNGRGPQPALRPVSRLKKAVIYTRHIQLLAVTRCYFGSISGINQVLSGLLLT